MFFLSLAGCAAKPPEVIFGTIPLGKTANSSSRFQLVDDFNSGISKTKLGTKWEAAEGANINLKAEHGDAVKHGGSLAIEFDFPVAAKASIFTVLNGLDTSQSKFLVFMARKEELDLFVGEIAIVLSDLSGNKTRVKIGPSAKRLWMGPTDEWIEIAIAKDQFGPVDFNRLDRLEIELSSHLPAKGKLVLDEVGFFGDEEVVFNSQRDNLVGFPALDVQAKRRNELLATQDDREFLKKVAEDSWLYFENIIDRNTHLVADHVRAGSSFGVGNYISPTNASLYWLANIAAMDLSLISKEKAIDNIRMSLDSFEKLSRWKFGFWYNFYDTGTLRVTRKYVSVVDNGWLAAGFVVLRQAFPEEFGDRVSKILKKLDFSEFYDVSNGQLKLGYDDDKGLFAPYHYGLLVTEARLASYVAIGKGDLEPEHWARIYRTLPVEWDWQKQVPEGTDSKLFGQPVFEGHYTYLGKKFVPSWGGSLFEFLSPALLVDEQGLAKESLGKNNLVATDLHIEHALKEQKYPVWGIAPCATRNGKYWVYREYGISQMGAKGYSDRGVIAPYASLLALATRPKEAIRNFREMLSRYPDLYGEYGYYDSVDVLKGIVNHQYLALDQAMSFLAITEYLTNGSIRRRFHSDPVGKKAELLLKDEKFSI